eukprot:3409244-Prymnesium_polylepis.2
MASERSARNSRKRSCQRCPPPRETRPLPANVNCGGGRRPVRGSGCCCSRGRAVGLASEAHRVFSARARSPRVPAQPA